MLRVSAILVLAGVFFACRDPKDRAGTTQLTGAELTSSDTAVERIVTARCAREVTCSNVGPDKHFTDGGHCVKEVQEHLKKVLCADECPDGVNATELDHCLDAIRAESCSNPISTIQRLAQCRIGTLCMKPVGRPLL